MKKYLSRFGLLLVLALVLSACSVDESSGDGKVEVEFWYGLGSEADTKMKELISDFNNQHDDIEVVAVPQADYDETYEKLQAAIASNTAPGVFIAELNPLTDLAKKEAIEPLDAYIENDDNYDEDDFLEALLKPGEIDGSLYAIPGYGTTQVMYYRKDIYEDVGIDPEEAYSTWENLADASKKLKDSGEVDYGHLPMWKADNLIDLVLSNGGAILNDDETEVLIDSPEWIEAWEFIRKQIHEEETMKVNSGGQGWEYWYKTIDQVMNGSAAGYTGSSGDKGDLDFDVMDSLPQPGLNGNEGKPRVNGLYMAIPEGISDEEKDAAYEWISYFSSSEVNADWSKTIGYVPVRESTTEEEVYADFVEENPYANVPYEQALTANPEFLDPTGGKILDALSIATDKVEIENIPAEEALKKAKEDAQAALDDVNNK
ncbi:multiple sugar transport system substrate-binding protein [Virgibacillus halotolerans]|uniref:ABC transporter substrate-binding protein n=1 Tax=Virgibacillus halotolerans TaxID=1071053 RepID=UPI00195FC88D|nr:ABC transporter substrate-binding protein [Virgibacillus halotolerans]MBM7601787.1 multiple sugar transport system substrate-binding protein [Virgibacillus halotolerans]